MSSTASNSAGSSAGPAASYAPKGQTPGGSALGIDGLPSDGSGPPGPENVDYAPTGVGTPLAEQPTNAEAAAELALNGSDVSATIKQSVQSELGSRVGALSDNDISGARSGAILAEIGSQSAKSMDESARTGVTVPPFLQASDIASWRADRQAAPSEPSTKPSPATPYPDPFSITAPTPGPKLS